MVIQSNDTTSYGDSESFSRDYEKELTMPSERAEDDDTIGTMRMHYNEDASLSHDEVREPNQDYEQDYGEASERDVMHHDDDESVFELNGVSDELAQKLMNRRDTIRSKTLNGDQQVVYEKEQAATSYHYNEQSGDRDESPMTSRDYSEQLVDYSEHGSVHSSTSYSTVDLSVASKKTTTKKEQVNLHEKLDGTSRRLDAALVMMEEFQREDANRKISKMMQVKIQVGKDGKYIDSTEQSKIDWETGEYDHTPWVGQVGVNDEIFEDEPLDYHDESTPPERPHFRIIPWISKQFTIRRQLLLAAAALLVIAGALGAGAARQYHIAHQPCSLCYGGDIPDDLSSSMVGGETCDEFRTSVESYRASDKMCLQGQSVAWLLCDCPSLPPFPKKPACTLCGEGILLKGSACNHINTFMAHISDPEYCEALKSSVSKAGCACPDE